jgi:pSer/pThr/pTyr-binding forkhead associated (FHA) protein
MSDCPKCGIDLPEGARVCQCGCDVPGSTASFEPVGDAKSTVDGGVDGSEGPVLVVRKGPQPGERFYIEAPELTVGRDPDSDIFLNDMTVSRTHAVLDLSGDMVSVRDAGSLNGTYLNGVCVDSAPLSDGDVLQIGTFQMVFFAGKRDES